MTANPTSKAEILRRIRAANHTTPTSDEAQTAWETLPRNYNRAGTLQPEALLQLFEDRLRDYDATVTRTTRQDLARAVALQLNARNKNRIVIPPGTPTEWLPQGFSFVADQALTPTQLDAFGGVLTSATLAIAETGTVVLQAPSQGRRALSPTITSASSTPTTSSKQSRKPSIACSPLPTSPPPSPPAPPQQPISK